MIRSRLLGFALFAALPLVGMAATWDNVSLVDVNCSNKVKANADAHTRDCALKCAKSGFAIVTSDGKVLKLDDSGNRQAVELLKASDKTDHLRVLVTGEESDGTVKVETLKLM